MRVAIYAGGHLANLGGGLMAVLSHVKALKELGHDVTVLVSVMPHAKVLDEWARGVKIAWYQKGIEAEFAGLVSVSHFDYAQPLAKQFNVIHYFFPSIDVPPPDGFRLYSNSQYTANAVKAKWGRDCTPMYIPIDQTFHSAHKEPIILHVSRFAEPSAWSDKGHRQMIQSIRRIRGQLNGWRLIMAGALEDRQEGYWSELLQTAQGLPIEFMPNLSQPEIVDLFSKSSIYWHATGMALANIPSAQEHLGLAPIEASASGAVPICYNSGGIPEVVQNGRTGILFDDPRELGDLTIKLISDMRIWSAFHQQGLWWGKSWQDFDAFKIRIQAMLEDKPIPPLPNYTPEMKFTPEDVTCVIPTRDNVDVLKKCIASLGQTVPDVSIIIINNGKELANTDIGANDKTRIVNTGQNLTFAQSNRLAENMITTPLVALINDDIEAIYKGWMNFALIPFNNPQVGVVGPKLLYPNGNIQYAGGNLDFNRMDIGYHRVYGSADGINLSEIERTDFATGAAMLIRKELFHISDDLLDNFNYEDSDMCLEALLKGYITVFQPASILVHAEGITKARTPDMQERVNKNRDAFRTKWQEWWRTRK